MCSMAGLSATVVSLCSSSPYGAARSCLMQVAATGAILLHQVAPTSDLCAVLTVSPCHGGTEHQHSSTPTQLHHIAGGPASTSLSCSPAHQLRAKHFHTPLSFHTPQPWGLASGSSSAPSIPRSRRRCGSWAGLGHLQQLQHTHQFNTSPHVSQQCTLTTTTTDVIHIKGARFYGYHGVLPAENAVGQPFVVDVSLHCDLRQAGHTDDLQHTVSYADVFQAVQQIMEGPPVQLLETLAHRICRHVLTQHAAVHAATVSVSKVHIPKLSAAVSSVGVQVHRTRADFTNL